MKRYIVAFLMLLATVLVQLKAQEHMTFMKVPIDGTITEFASKMKAKGFIQDYVEEDAVVMEGSFMGRSCRIYILGSPKTKTVYTVVVNIEKKYTSWYSIKNAYNEIVDSYIGKYGVPAKKLNFFNSPYYEGDGYELQAIRMDKCNYVSKWEEEDGIILVYITKSTQITISYNDRLNGEKKEAEEQSQINEDI